MALDTVKYKEFVDILNKNYRKFNRSYRFAGAWSTSNGTFTVNGWDIGNFGKYRAVIFENISVTRDNYSPDEYFINTSSITEISLKTFDKFALVESGSTLYDACFGTTTNPAIYYFSGLFNANRIIGSKRKYAPKKVLNGDNAVDNFINLLKWALEEKDKAQSKADANKAIRQKKAKIEAIGIKSEIEDYLTDVDTSAIKVESKCTTTLSKVTIWSQRSWPTHKVAGPVYVSISIHNKKNTITVDSDIFKKQIHFNGANKTEAYNLVKYMALTMEKCIT